jgi:hypothetical protein
VQRCIARGKAGQYPRFKLIGEDGGWLGAAPDGEPIRRPQQIADLGCFLWSLSACPLIRRRWYRRLPSRESVRPVVTLALREQGIKPRFKALVWRHGLSSSRSSALHHA